MKEDNVEFLERIKKLVIIAMFSDDALMERLVLKGGNLLDIVYGVSTRASVDVDLSIDGEFDDIDSLRDRVANTLRATFKEAGYVAFDIALREVPACLSDDMADFWGGYRVEFKIIDRERHAKLKDNLDVLRRHSLSVGKRASTKFRIDISKHEYCDPKQPRSLDGYTIYSYTPEMVVSEKLRAICQQVPEYVQRVKSHTRARARDFVDIHTVTERCAVDWKSQGFRHVLKEVFAIKQVPFLLIESIGDSREFHRQDFSAVQATVKANVKLEEFDFYFDYVLDKCRDLEFFWNE